MLDTTILTADDSEQLSLDAEHDSMSDLYFRRADDELDIALDLRDWRLIHNHIRAAIDLMAEGYRLAARDDAHLAQEA